MVNHAWSVLLDHYTSPWTYSHSIRIVLVDLNNFWSVFWKVHHSHSFYRHQKTTSNFLRITLKADRWLGYEWSLEGATLSLKMFEWIIHSIYGVKRFHSLSSEFHSILTPVQWKCTTQGLEWNLVRFTQNIHSKRSDHWRQYPGSENRSIF